MAQSTRYVLIPCRTCGSQMFVIGERPLPKRCTRCGAAFDPESRAFDVRSAPRVTVRGSGLEP
jgi:DNA-directed RNA polymerase subunit RPC12/RpoP